MTPSSPDDASSSPDDALAAGVRAALVAAGATVATAESLTGGLVAARLASVAGASDVLRGGVVAYATDVKASVLGVDPGLLAREGPVHPDVAAALARGAVRVLGATYGLGLTGVAGPGPHDGYPAGTYHVAVAGPGAGPAGVRVASPPPAGGDRNAVRAAAADHVLRLLLDVLGAGRTGTGATTNTR